MANLLTPKNKVICEEIAKGEDSLHSKRAKALLSLNEGNTQAKAAQDSDLSVGQVRYALAKYRSVGAALFPETVKSTDTLSETVEETPVQKAEPKKEPAKKEKKVKDKKSDKKSDKKVKKDSKKESKKNKKTDKKSKKKKEKKSKKDKK